MEGYCIPFEMLSEKRNRIYTNSLNVYNIQNVLKYSYAYTLRERET